MAPDRWSLSAGFGREVGDDTEQIATALRLMVGGDTEVSRFRDPTIDEDYYVQLRLSEKDRGDLGTISRLFVSRQGGEIGPDRLVRLDNLVQIAPGFTASRIDRSDRQREVRLRAAILPGFGQADRIAALKPAVVVTQEFHAAKGFGADTSPDAVRLRDELRWGPDEYRWFVATLAERVTVYDGEAGFFPPPVTG